MKEGLFIIISIISIIIIIIIGVFAVAWGVKFFEWCATKGLLPC